MTMRWVTCALLLLLVAAACAWAQELSGEWSAEITLDPAATTIAGFLGFSTAATVTYEVGGWVFTTSTQVNDTGWLDQKFSAGGVLGALTIGSNLDLAPVGAFESWDIAVGTTFGGVTIDGKLTLADLDVTFVVGGTSSTGVVDIDVNVTFGGDDNDVCDFDWAGASISLDFPFCCADVTATVEFDCDGFEYLALDVDGIVIPALPWVTIDSDLKFDLQSKSLTLSPNVNFDAGVCFDVHVSVDTSDNLEIGDIHIDGIELECKFDYVTFTGISFWGGGTKPGELGDYWEMYKIESDDESCCGALSFEAAVFFDAASVNLADVALFTTEMEIEFGDPFTFSTGLDVDVVAGTVELRFGFAIDW